MRLLLDAHISPALAHGLLLDGVDTVSMRDWLGGNYRAATDEQILTAAAADERVLVTYDLRTIPTLLREWGASGRPHAGVVLVDDKTLASSNVGGLRSALRALVTELGNEVWSNRVVFLRARDRSGESNR